MTLIRKCWQQVLSVLYPEGVMCHACQKPAHGAELCEACAAELASLRLETTWSAPWLDGAVHSAYLYEGAARELVHALKYHCDAHAAEMLAAPMAELADGWLLSPDVVVTWVTMPESRLRSRGVDHGALLAGAVARRLKLDVRCLMQRRARRFERTQRGLDMEQRLRNLRGLFSCTGEVPRRVLLVDDVLTTGATARTCAECLRRGGAEEVYVLTATRVVR